MKKSKKNEILNEAGILPQNLDLNDEFLNAFKTMEETNDCIFVTGKAGTGKSTLLKYFKKNTLKNVVVLAPTGISAVNIGGQTLHSFFRLPPRLIQKYNIHKHRNKKIIQNLDTVIIDEVSMVRADLMDGIDYALRLNRGQMQVPFGGVQIIFFGDLFQLPPVITNDIKQILNEMYVSPYFFNADVFKEMNLKSIELQNIYRQKDKKFINLLNKIRNKTQKLEDLKILNTRIKYNTPQKNKNCVTLTATNYQADLINTRKLNELPDITYTYEADIDGDFDEKLCSTGYYLNIKKGAQVILLRNDPEKRWVNGTIAQIESLNENSIKIAIGSNVYDVPRLKWEKIKYEYNEIEEKIETETVGTFEQYPIKLAWAITIHKAQGQTFDNVIIDLGRGAFTHGQTYVALSRCSTLEGIILKTPIRLSDIIFDKRIYDFKKLLFNKPKTSEIQYSLKPLLDKLPSK